MVRGCRTPRPLLLVPQQQLPPLVVRVVVVREDERADPLEEDDDEDRGEEQKDEEVHQALGRRRAPRHAPDQSAREVQVRLDVLAPPWDATNRGPRRRCNGPTRP